MNTAKISGTFALGALLGAVLGRRFLSARRFSFQGRTVLITGGSRGLGLVMARQLAAAGARLALVARDEQELERARTQLAGAGAEVLTLACDVRVQADVNAAVRETVKRYGGIDVLINNAGVIQVGPLEQMTVKDFKDALAVHLFGPLFFTLAVLPHMRRGGAGRIVNISSVGGKIAVPHLLPYTVSKFALVGLSDGLRAELRRDNIRVTTVCPGLMRTGSARNASFKGKRRLEYAWFAIADSLPVLSVSADNAARQILSACRKGKARLIIGAHTKAAVLLNEIMPCAMAELSALANRLLPGPASAGKTAEPGYMNESELTPDWLMRWGEEAARANNEMGAA